MPNLYEIAAEYAATMAALENPDVDPDNVLALLDEMEGEFNHKALCVAGMILNLEASGKAVAERAKKVAARAKAISNKVEKLKWYLLQNMAATETQKLTDGEIIVRYDPGQPKLVMEDELAVPAEFWKKTPASKAVDKNAVLEALKDGQEIPGCKLENVPYVTIQ